ncbi:MAG: hypothetical protein ACTHM0_13475 [Sphingomonas sp.]
MSIDETPEERLRAEITAHTVMLRDLWAYVLSGRADWRKELATLESASLTEFEEALASFVGRDAEFTQHLAIAHLEDLWRLIRIALASREQPADQQPGGGARTRPGKLPKEAPIGEPNDTPDQ